MQTFVQHADILAMDKKLHPTVYSGVQLLIHVLHTFLLQTKAGSESKNYHKTSSISHIKSQNLNVSNLVLQLSLLNPFKLGVKSRMKM